MERKYYKAINFDLDTNRLKEYYPRYQQAYKDILKFLKERIFHIAKDRDMYQIIKCHKRKLWI